MKLLGLLLGATAVRQLTDYPSEIRNLRRQMPKEEREAFSRDYKKLSSESKAQFKDYLKQANLQAAGSLVGRDLSQYRVTQSMKPGKEEPQLQLETQADSGTDIVSRVNRILAVPTDIDPALVAEAARKYEEAVPAKSLTITERTERILDLSR